MRLIYVVLAAAVALFVNSDIASATTESLRIQPSIDNIKEQHAVENSSPSKRLLRVANKYKDGGEERGLQKELPGGFVKNLLKNADLRMNTFNDWDKADITVTGLANSLKIWTSKHQLAEKLMKPTKKDKLALLEKYRDYLAGP
ncbi:Secreted RxLR effector peptide protein [Phytophthora palmivora]|uniref:RxLR effector protein n=1 Tax=Phytophthora palmivora TaxID=4796 RepID=A0A2P4XIT9_9STRA|nr:Secreted RxLR effector peptide protein [Phytophthora palmivora]